MIESSSQSSNSFFVNDPGGIHENSPTFQRWVLAANLSTRPEGTFESINALVRGHVEEDRARIQPSLRDLVSSQPEIPTLKRRAIVAHPFGMDHLTKASSKGRSA